MPLKVDSLLTNSIVLNGTQLSSNQSLFTGRVNVNNDYITIGSTETIVETLFLPANTIKGIAFPSYELILGCDNGTYTDLILKMYVSQSNSIEGQTPLFQDTISNRVSPKYNGPFNLASNLSPGIGNSYLIDFVTDKMYVLSDDGNFPNPVFSTSIFDNFDVSKDLYVIITAEKIGPSLGVKCLAIAVAPFK